MSRGRFISNRVGELVASGCVGACGRTPPYAVDINVDGVLVCSGQPHNKFHISVDIKTALVESGDEWVVQHSHVRCILADGIHSRCEGTLDPVNGTLFLRSIDKQHAFFWFEVRPRAV